MPSTVLKVTGMHCGHCQGKVEQALRGVEGVYAATVSLAAGEAEVDGADGVSADRLVAAVERAGYRASVVA
jgi:copper chaperone CopZ